MFRPDPDLDPIIIKDTISTYSTFEYRLFYSQLILRAKKIETCFQYMYAQIILIFNPNISIYILRSIRFFFLNHLLFCSK